MFRCIELRYIEVKVSDHLLQSKTGVAFLLQCSAFLRVLYCAFCNFLQVLAVRIFLIAVFFGFALLQSFHALPIIAPITQPFCSSVKHTAIFFDVSVYACAFFSLHRFLVQLLILSITFPALPFHNSFGSSSSFFSFEQSFSPLLLSHLMLVALHQVFQGGQDTPVLSPMFDIFFSPPSQSVYGNHLSSSAF